MTSGLVQCAFSTERFLAHTVRLLLLPVSSGYLKSLLSHRGGAASSAAFPPLAARGSWCRDRLFVYRHGHLILRAISFGVSFGRRCRGEQKRGLWLCRAVKRGNKANNPDAAELAEFGAGEIVAVSYIATRPNHCNLASPR